MGFDTTIRETKEKIIQVLNESGLHIDVLDMMLELLHLSIHQQAEAVCRAATQQQKQEGGGGEVDGAK